MQNRPSICLEALDIKKFSETTALLSGAMQNMSCIAKLTFKAPRKTASENVVCYMLSAEYSCGLFKTIFAYRQTVWILIRLLEQSDLGPHCLQKWLLKSQADDKADDNSYDWHFKG